MTQSNERESEGSILTPLEGLVGGLSLIQQVQVVAHEQTAAHISINNNNNSSQGDSQYGQAHHRGDHEDHDEAQVVVEHELQHHPRAGLELLYRYYSLQPAGCT